MKDRLEDRVQRESKEEEEDEIRDRTKDVHRFHGFREERAKGSCAAMNSLSLHTYTRTFIPTVGVIMAYPNHRHKCNV